AIPEEPASGMEGVSVVLTQPPVGVEAVILLAPEHTGQGLAHGVGRVRRHRGRAHRAIEFVRLPNTRGQGLPERRPEGDGSRGALVGETQPYRRRLPGSDGHPGVRGDLGALLVRTHGLVVTVDDSLVDAVLHVGARVRILWEEPTIVRLVL